MDSLITLLKDYVASDNPFVEFIKIAGPILAGLCGIISTIRFGRRLWRAHKRQKIAEESKTPEKIAEKAAETLRAALLENLHYVKKLTTIEQFIEGNIPLKKNKKLLNFNVGTNECTLLYKGKITCGCDLQQIQFVPSENISGGVKILSPHCKILEDYVDISTIQIVYEKKSRFFTPEITPEEQNAVINDDFEKQKQHKIDEGILTLADEKVHEMLLKLSGNKKIPVEIIYIESAPPLPQLNSPTENQGNVEV
ncbi:MAG: DUF4230 domain-containing protein [Selenomonadaceae bacterium]|nr:DUF4230 domain-containing protein [Selenomonadaceae bacterium]